ncbi:MAG: roadblock/LC7 domain-containing protein [Gemmatimonadetes bacterium]|nr:roadblock/LC7 domain-containing protein [Gemmatimonadota bacterium]HNV74777.1 roadblock/LC7 domain-containing protein [Gemmatimonadaceae bacterium]MBK7835957.1 roadblock/LC7 domain-containing protein [Gemmatimonadota bacterium]MBK8062351.1 roadblock/LC7 domain-containing protein [Gemmatimonadota bacterium]MBK8646001.1 roadblock/LC7 domain-containing protein [Gemmatimonadota bacterium]
MSARTLSPSITALARLRGVRGVVVTSVRDALPIESSAHVDVDVDALAAFATALHRRAHQSAECSEAGAVRLLSLDAAAGRLMAAARGELLIVVLAGREANPGLLRVSLQRALEGLG